MMDKKGQKRMYLHFGLSSTLCCPILVLWKNYCHYGHGIQKSNHEISNRKNWPARHVDLYLGGSKERIEETGIR